MTDFFTFVEHIDWMVLFGLALVFGSVMIFVRMTHDKRSQFDFAQMFIGEDGLTSMSKFSAFLGTLASTWVVIAYAAARQLTDTIFIGYLTVLVAGKVASEFVAAKKVEAKDKIDAGIVDAPPVMPANITIQSGPAPVAPVAAPLGTPDKPINVALVDDDAPKAAVKTTERRPLGKKT